MEYVIGILLGAVITYLVYDRIAKKSSPNTRTQSVVLMERIRTVCKLISVEGDFAEIYHYESLKDKWVNRLLGSKKALVLIDAKAYVGFDLTKIQMKADEQTKTIKLYDFPQPEILSVETDFKFYDKKSGWANPITSTDLTEINKEAKQQIIDKIPGSGLYSEAKKQALDTIFLMEKLVETIGWTLEYSPLKIEDTATKQLKE